MMSSWGLRVVYQEICNVFGSLKVENTYHPEYGYSCMGYEVNAALGVKVEPHREALSY